MKKRRLPGKPANAFFYEMVSGFFPGSHGERSVSYTHLDVYKRQGLPCAGVLYGYGSREELEQAGAQWILETPAQLSQLARL